MNLSQRQQKFLSQARIWAAVIGANPAIAWIAALALAGGVSLGQFFFGLLIGAVVYMIALRIQKANMPRE